MSGDNDDVIFEKLDAIQKDINTTNVIIARFMGEAKACRIKCEDSHKAVFGNGGPGLKTKVYIIWGGQKTI